MKLSQGSKAVAAAGTAVPLVASSTLVASVELHARKSRTAANTGDVYVGFTGGASAQLRQLAPGAVMTLAAPAGYRIDLASIYLDAATNADAVTWSAVG